VRAMGTISSDTFEFAEKCFLHYSRKCCSRFCIQQSKIMWCFYEKTTIQVWIFFEYNSNSFRI